jgi:dihydroorotate dehydrogenase (fumarate)
MDLKCTLMGLELEHPLMNAAGTCKTIEDVRNLSLSATAAIVVGSITMEERAGNEGNVFWPGDIYSINSLGLPNGGRKYYETNLPEMARISRGAGKPLIVSIAGFSAEEYGKLAEIAFEKGADAIEINLGCPNKWLDGKQLRIPCFDRDKVEDILHYTTHCVGDNVRATVKNSSYSDPFALNAQAEVIFSKWLCKAITAINTLANAMVYDENGKPTITPGEGLAGLSGPALKPIGLGQVVQYSRYYKSIQKLHATLPLPQIIGVGGINSGRDMWEYLHAGASAVQIATAYLKRREHVFQEILVEYIDICERLGNPQEGA